MPKQSDNINHLNYVDDTILFILADKRYLQMVMKTLEEYEEQSGQKFNKEKSVFYVHNKTANIVIQEVDNYIVFPIGKFPLIHLGCSIDH